jgi:hypothetical protein
MKLTDMERTLVETSRKLESQKCREDLVFQCEVMAQAQDALKADCGLTGLDAPLSNGTGSATGSAA